MLASSLPWISSMLAKCLCNIFRLLFLACLAFGLRCVYVFFRFGLGLIQGWVSGLLLIGLRLVTVGAKFSLKVCVQFPS